MDRPNENEPALPNEGRPNRWQRIRKAIKIAGPFGAGVAAALLGLLLYSRLFPAPAALTTTEVGTVVAEAMAEATPGPANASLAYRAIQPSLVWVQTERLDTAGENENALGSGVVISTRGEILTALHVVEDAAAIQVTFADGTRAPAAILSSQPENDIAVLQPAALPEVLVPAVMGNPLAVSIGDETYAVGNPFGLYGSMSSGVISGLDRSFQGEDSEQALEGLIQIDTAVNPGNSGGPLLNRDGQVIGIVVGVLNPIEEEFFVGIGFAVPITTAAGGGGGDGPQY